MAGERRLTKAAGVLPWWGGVLMAAVVVWMSCRSGSKEEVDGVEGRRAGEREGLAPIMALGILRMSSPILGLPLVGTPVSTFVTIL